MCSVRRDWIRGGSPLPGKAAYRFRMLPGRMMDFPLTITHLLTHAEQFFGTREVVSTLPDRSKQRSNYAEIGARARRLANALEKLDVKPGDRVATLCWNHRQHLEAYFGIPGTGAVIHTLNLRLHPKEIGYIANHAEDTVVIVDHSLLPLFEQFRPTLKSLRHVIVVNPENKPLDEGQSGYLDYETILAAAPSAYDWPALDEKAAAMLCYTSGTTGNPKGVLYTHRSIVLHALVCAQGNHMGITGDDVVLPVVPMFHASAWGLPFIAILAGAKLVFPGPYLDPPSLLGLMESENVTAAGGVPTIWLGILAILDENPKKYDLSSVRTMLIGGSAAPPGMIEGFQTRHGLSVLHAWGMTETNPVGTLARVKPHLHGDIKHELPIRASQGFALPFVETRHVDGAGKVLPWDGTSAGELECRGAWVAASYFGDEGKDRFTADGWFKTGDVVTIDAEGYLSITDREKDVIKSGGEWIASVAMEDLLMSHPAVLEAAVFAAKHEKWTERPVAAVVFKPNHTATEAELAAHLAGNFTKYQRPDAYVFMDQIPRTSTGKFLKTKLRETYGDILTARASTSKK